MSLHRPPRFLRHGKFTPGAVFPQVRAHQLVLPPCDVVIKVVSDYVRSIPDVGDLEAIAQDVFKNSQVRKAALRRGETAALHLYSQRWMSLSLSIQDGSGAGESSS